MKIGVYLGEFNPHSGGANTLQGTIIGELTGYKSDKYDFLFFYYDKSRDRKKRVGDLLFYNINRQCNIVKKFKKKFYSTINSPKECDYYLFDIIGQRYNIDIFWITVPCNIDITYPYIFTVWDLGHRTIPFFPEVRRGRQWVVRETRYSKMLPGATYVLTGNETGKNEIVRNYMISPDRIYTAPFPISAFCFKEETKPDFELPEEFFIYPAQFWPHKNHICILEAVKKLKDKYNLCLKVYFSGADYGNKAYIERMAEIYGISDLIVFTGFIDDGDLKYLYTHATAMIYASLLGPNNLPPLEAKYLGCPIIITDLDGHKEQLGDCALYFDGLNSDELVDCMYCLATDREKRNRLKNKELEEAKAFEDYKYYYSIINILEDYSIIRRRWE